MLNERTANQRDVQKEVREANKACWLETQTTEKKITRHPGAFTYNRAAVFLVEDPVDHVLGAFQGILRHSVKGGGGRLSASNTESGIGTRLLDEGIARGSNRASHEGGEGERKVHGRKCYTLYYDDDVCVRGKETREGRSDDDDGWIAAGMHARETERKVTREYLHFSSPRFHVGRREGRWYVIAEAE